MDKYNIVVYDKFETIVRIIYYWFMNENLYPSHDLIGRNIDIKI